MNFVKKNLMNSLNIGMSHNISGALSIIEGIEGLNTKKSPKKRGTTCSEGCNYEYIEDDFKYCDEHHTYQLFRGDVWRFLTGVTSVSGLIRVPRPAASIIAFIKKSSLLRVRL